MTKIYSINSDVKFPDMEHYDMGKASDMALYLAHCDFYPFRSVIENNKIALDAIDESYRNLAEEARLKNDFFTEQWAMTSGTLHSCRVDLLTQYSLLLTMVSLLEEAVELEERIEDAKLRKSSIEMETITLDNIYKLMLNFGKLYDIISDEEKKSLITYLIKEIQIYPNGESEQPLKSIEFNFPIYRDGQEVRRLLWEKGNTVETVCLLSRKAPV